MGLKEKEFNKNKKITPYGLGQRLTGPNRSLSDSKVKTHFSLLHFSVYKDKHTARIQGFDSCRSIALLVVDDTACILTT
ncbi:hypothetical protein SADUNF_Sadunf04G0144200 [Salix dunnii]|uniref:Uncharacterized protein n=1 Tax=Salix dunnii TaxID=1413687 RepID=A0A835K8I6_9ROSI|nr:hypothetical protein SADUNF_Sadunf04G0144200 [Salix dunnii]